MTKLQMKTYEVQKNLKFPMQDILGQMILGNENLVRCCDVVYDPQMIILDF